MIFIVDANIIFSAILNPSRQISTILLGIVKSDIILISPAFLKNEMQKHKQRLCTLTRLPGVAIDEMLELYYKRIVFYSEEIIPSEIWNHADSFTKGVDIKDSVYVAFAIFFQCKVWSGDKSLKNHLAKKGFDLIVNTPELLEQT
jgi:predicted nucleic acid-binding protein